MMFANALTLFMSFALFGLTFADEIVAKGHGDAWQYGTGGGVVGLIVLVLDIFVFRKSSLVHVRPSVSAF